MGGEPMKEGENMGMTNKQFNGFIRFIIDALTEIHDALADSPQKDKLKKVITNLQETLEDDGN